MANIYPVIMCGGSGTRLWPVSRKSYPKQFADLFPGGSLFQHTLGRLTGQDYADPILLTNEDFRFITAEQMQLAGAAATRIVIEPQGRNTGPAVAVAAQLVAQMDPDGILMVLPSDHLIADEDAFAAATVQAAEAAAQGHMVTFGIQPDRPETGYGYIELEAAGGQGARPFVRFVEKPDAARAAEMLAEGRFLWNSGMFVFQARTVLNAFAAHAPDVHAAAAKAIAEGREDLDFYRLGAEAYAASPDISIDYAIMEHVQ
ncbi:MAG: mannose-1-phosphate guanylyltransferase, partial [Paracoccaceae bacterium]